MMPYGRQLIDEEDIQAVVDVLRSDRLTQGPLPALFEQALCEYTGAAYAAVCVNGTAALHLAMLALGIKQGDRVWTSSLSFVASANAALYCGAEVDFVDIDADSFNISLDALKHKLAHAKSNHALPSALVLVHMAGNPAMLAELAQLKAEYGFSIIEDACHALGASYQGDKVGACTYADLCVFSFHPVKSITSGEGGAVLSNDPLLIERVRLYSSHGITRDISRFQTDDPGPWVYEQHLLGYNYRISDIHAALGLSQLKKLDQRVTKRAQLVSNYQQTLADLPLGFQRIDPTNSSSHHLFIILMPDAKDDAMRRDLYAFLARDKISAQVHYIPIHTQPYYRQRYPEKHWSLPETERFYRRSLSIPLFPGMNQEDVAQVASTIRRFFVGYKKGESLRNKFAC